MKKGGISMKKESTTFIVSVIIILAIALIGFNFEEITGKAITHKYPIVSVYRVDSRGKEFPEQNEVTAGEKIRIKIQVGEYSVKTPVYIECTTGLETLNKNFGIATLRPGYGAGRDKNIFTIDYSTHSNWEGECFAKVYFWKDRNTKDYLRSYFTVIPKEK